MAIRALLLAVLCVQWGCITPTAPELPVANPFAPTVTPSEPAPHREIPPPPPTPEPPPSDAGVEVPPPPAPEPENERGFASFYADMLRGAMTASGERYDPKKPTCAHPTHRFGTRLRVKNLKTGRSVVCRVNDRGPYAKNRVLDLSKSLARELGIVRRGVAEVEITVE